MRTSRILVVLICIASYFVGNAQNNNWKEGFGRADGLQEMNGFKVSWMQTTCDNKQLIFLKMENNNSYPINVSWTDALVSSKDGWVYNKDNKKSIFIQGNSEITPSCDEMDDDLVIYIADFFNPEQLKYYGIQDVVIEKQ